MLVNSFHISWYSKGKPIGLLSLRGLPYFQIFLFNFNPTHIEYVKTTMLHTLWEDLKSLTHNYAYDKYFLIVLTSRHKMRSLICLQSIASVVHWIIKAPASFPNNWPTRVHVLRFKHKVLSKIRLTPQSISFECLWCPFKSHSQSLKTMIAHYLLRN